jgi:hypothetical protein
MQLTETHQTKTHQTKTTTKALAPYANQTSQNRDEDT